MAKRPKRSRYAPLVVTLVVTTALFASCDGVNGGIGPINPGPKSDELVDADAITGTGKTAVEIREVAGFDRIALYGEGHVIVTQDMEESLEIETDDNLLQYIESSVSGGVLEIRTSSGIDIDPTDSVIYRIGIVDIAGIELGGAGSVDTGPLIAPELFLSVNGVGDIYIAQVDTDMLTVDFGGVGSIRLDGGAVREASISANGVGSFAAPNVRIDSASVDVRGNAAATIWARYALTVTVADNGAVEYYGEPEVTSSTSDLGTLTALGDK